MAGLWEALAERPDLALLPYLLSLRARLGRRPPLPRVRPLPSGVIHLPLPAGVALRAWSRSDHPAVDRWLGRGPRPRAQVVHATNFLAPPLRRAATVVTVHDCSFLRSPHLATPTVRRFAPALSRAIRRGAWVHTPSRYVADEVSELFSTERVAAVPSGIPPLAEAGATGEADGPGRPGHGQGQGSFILALGTLEGRKNHPRLIAAFGEVAAGRPGLRLLLAGPDGTGRPAVDEAVGQLPAAVRERVLLVGPVDEAARSHLLRDATLLAYPSLDEGFGFPVLEAMAAGTPVVAAAAGAIPEVAGDAALLVDPTDVAAIGAAICSVCDDTGLRDRLVRAGRSRAARFSWRATADGLADLYRKAADD